MIVRLRALHKNTPNKTSQRRFDLSYRYFKFLGDRTKLKGYDRIKYKFKMFTNVKSKMDVVFGAQVLQLVLVGYIFISLMRFKEINTRFYLFLLFGLIVFQMVVPPLFRRYLNAADNMKVTVGNSTTSTGPAGVKRT